MYLFQQLMMRLGYVKIPKELVQLSMCQETFLQNIVAHWADTDTLQMPIDHLNNQLSITKYLREGRFNSYVEEKK